MEKTAEAIAMAKVIKAQYDCEAASVEAQLAHLAQRARERRDHYTALKQQLDLLRQDTLEDIKLVEQFRRSRVAGQFLDNQSTACEAFTRANQSDDYATILRFYSDLGDFSRALASRLEQLSDEHRSGLTACDELSAGNREIAHFIEANARTTSAAYGATSRSAAFGAGYRSVTDLL